MDTEFSKVTKVLKKQSDVYILISPVQVRGENNNPEGVKIPGVSHMKENFLYLVFKRSQFNHQFNDLVCFLLLILDKIRMSVNYVKKLKSNSLIS